MNAAGHSDVARVFFALTPGEDCRRRLSAVAEDFAARFGGKAMAPLHLTLAFVGEVGVDRLPGLMAAASEVAPAMVSGSFILDRLRYRPAGKMLWAACDHCPSPLGALVNQLRSSLLVRGYALEPRPFVAHVTLLRRLTVWPPAGDLEVVNKAPVRWPYHDFVLLRSRPGAAGSSYERLGAWALGGN